MNYCPYCSDDYQKISHGGTCPRVKAIEYYPNGTIKRVEFHGPHPQRVLDVSDMTPRQAEQTIQDWRDQWTTFAGKY